MYGTDAKEVLIDRWHNVDFTRVEDEDVRGLLLALRDDVLTLLVPHGIKDEDIGCFLRRMAKIAFEVNLFSHSRLASKELNTFLDELDGLIFDSYLSILPEHIRPLVEKANYDRNMSLRGVR